MNLKFFFLVIVFLFVGNLHELQAQNWDFKTLQSIHENRNPKLDATMYWTSATIYPIGVAAPLTSLAIGIIQKDSTQLATGIFMLGSAALNFGLTFATKQIVDRPRPFESYPILIPYYQPMSSSFPSAHTAIAFNVATNLSLAYPKWYVIAPAALWSVGIAYSRLHLGVHYPSDVMAGALIGIGSAFASYYLNRWIQGKYTYANLLRYPSFSLNQKLDF